jgi:hypothetical protein
MEGQAYGAVQMLFRARFQPGLGLFVSSLSAVVDTEKQIKGCTQKQHTQCE